MAFDATFLFWSFLSLFLSLLPSSLIFSTKNSLRKSHLEEEISSPPSLARGNTYILHSMVHMQNKKKKKKQEKEPIFSVQFLRLKHKFHGSSFSSTTKQDKSIMSIKIAENLIHNC